MTDSQKPTFLVREMTEQDLAAGLALTQQAGWPHRLEDWRLHFDSGRGWVACETSGKIIGTLLVWEFGADKEVATVGLIVVDEQCQGRGIGRQLMQRALQETSAREIRLVGTDVGLKLYHSSGFETVGMIRQRQGEVGTVTPIAPAANQTLREVTPNDLAAIIALDEQAFGAARSKLLGLMLPQCRGLILEEQSVARGFALIRHGGRGLQIGPLVAEFEQQAILLLSHLIKSEQGFTRIDITESATVLDAWLDDIGMLPCDRVTAMRKSEVASSVDSKSCLKIFALISQAFG